MEIDREVAISHHLEIRGLCEPPHQVGCNGPVSGWMDAGRLLRSRAAGGGAARVCISDGERVQMVWRLAMPRSPDHSAVFSEAAGALPRVGGLAQFSAGAQRVWRLTICGRGNHWPGLIPVAEVLVSILRV